MNTVKNLILTLFGIKKPEVLRKRNGVSRAYKQSMTEGLIDLNHKLKKAS